MIEPNKNKAKRIGIVCSHGGHLEDVLTIFDAFNDSEVFLVSYNIPTLKNFQFSGISKFYYLRYFGDSIVEIFLSLLLSCFSYIKIFLKERPQIIFSTGSEIVFPAFFIGKFLFSSKLIFLEQFTRVDEPSLTAKSVYYVSDLFLVQHESLLSKFGKKAKYVGSIL